MNIVEYAKLILFSGRLEDKLTDPSIVDDFDISKLQDSKLSDLVPTRSDKIIFSSEQIKFPKNPNLKFDDKKSIALHFFANHELLAIEMMAAALLYLPIEGEHSKRIKVGLLQTIKDEQKHFKMYRSRMNDFGVDFGDFPVNDFFWRQMQKIENFNQYLCVMSLTFESANLDFAKFYSKLFKEFDDSITSKILDVVYQDEISHVAFGAKWLNFYKNDKSLWQYYVANLPDLMTPARAKGKTFDFEGRLKAGLDKNFVESLNSYRDEFFVTDRKEWKK